MSFAFRSLALGACVALALPASAREFRSADIHPTDYPTVEAVRFMGQQLGEQTGGEMGVKVYPNGALGNERDTIEQLKIGGLDMMRINVAPLNNIVPETIVPALPFLFRSEEHMHAVLDGPVGDEILAAMEAQGMIGLAFYDSGARSIYTASKPIKNLADVERDEDPRPAVGSVRGHGRGAGREPHSDALRRGLYRAEDRHRRCRREQLPVLQLLAAFRGSEILHADRALDGARGAGVLQGDLGHAVSRKIRRRSARPPRIRCRTCAGSGTSVRPSREATVKAAGSEIIPLEDRQAWVDAMQPVYAKFASTPELQSLVQKVQATQ